MKQLDEGIRSAEFGRASTIILRYFKKNLGQKTFLYPKPEEVKSGGKNVVGIRYFFGGTKSVRLNWGQTGNSISASKSIVSFDFWDGTTKGRPTSHVEVSSRASLVKVLPLVVDFCLGKVSGDSGVFLEESVDYVHLMAFNSGYSQTIEEAAVTSGELSVTMSKTIDALLNGLTPSDQYRDGGNKKFGPGWNKIMDLIRSRHPEVFGKDGKKMIVNREKVGSIDAKAIIAAITGDDPNTISFQVSPGKIEQYPDEVSSEELDRLSYEEQLDSLKTSLRLLVTKATNAVFIAGRGGCLSGDTEVNIMYQ